MCQYKMKKRLLFNRKTRTFFFFLSFRLHYTLANNLSWWRVKFKHEALLQIFFCVQQWVGFLTRHAGSGIASSKAVRLHFPLVKGLISRHYMTLSLSTWNHSGSLGQPTACHLTPLWVGIQHHISAASPYCCHSNTLFCARVWVVVASDWWSCSSC